MGCAGAALLRPTVWRRDRTSGASGRPRVLVQCQLREIPSHIYTAICEPLLPRGLASQFDGLYRVVHEDTPHATCTLAQLQQFQDGSGEPVSPSEFGRKG